MHPCSLDSMEVTVREEAIKDKDQQTRDICEPSKAGIAGNIHIMTLLSNGQIDDRTGEVISGQYDLLFQVSHIQTRADHP